MKGAIFLLLAATIHAEELPLVCTPSKAVVSNRESIEVIAWTPPGKWTLTWRADAGQLDAKGKNALWDLNDTAAGRKNAFVSAVRPGAAPLSCVATIWVETRVETRGDRLTRRFLISPDQGEPADYGLYSYVLLTPDAGEATAKDRNRQAIESWHQKLLAKHI